MSETSLIVSSQWLWKKHKNSLLEALEKIKAELMILGFISLLLTFGETYILKICVSRKAALSMLPCSSEDTELFQKLAPSLSRHLLAAGDISVNCKQGSEPLITLKGLHQLHILLFFLAVFHVLYSLITMMLSRLKIRGWKKWEQETLSHDYEFSIDHSRLRLTHETSFVREHTSFWTTIPFFFYVGCFFRQFFVSVERTDYLTLRHGFISAHLAPGRKFNFQRYIKRSLEDDFKLVVGISPVLWASFVIFLLFNVNGWRTLFWASIPPLLIILAVGTKLQAIMATMALEIVETHAIVQGMPLVQGSDQYFWFDCPQLLLHLIHFALFQNAFQITHFFWIWYSFGLKSCFHKDFNLVVIKLFLCLGALILCSYITLPLYALVTQMGSHMKKAVFDEQMAKALKKWHKDIKLKKGKARKLPSKTLGVSESFSLSSSSSATTLHRSKTTGHSSNMIYYKQEDEEDEMSDLEAGAEDAIDRIQQQQMEFHHS
ncbi:MLO-like protein 7 isoform X1 [Arabidopsis lyrata subsp. lyrata]|uniref:MLO-like protein 7 isoform X1 n=1 Tax=Arabidopsis lyrata subsp. lyrata TaxID=81972 RepID=UPI000A29E255|nr:MLO-like protein 7 isoform X1 [Arabidopsis lyrata subsp. lyrata]|eukprot:XP_020889260.1 MLO-like protein 7 isoform X1 [Arabidopsis lyrata subsp. lyrata]